MEQNFTVKNAKHILYNEISNYYNKIDSLKDLKSKICICNDILSILKIDLKDMFHQIEVLSFFLDMIYDEFEAKRIHNRINYIVSNSAFTNDEIILRDALIALDLIKQKIQDKKDELILKHNRTNYEIENEKIIIQKYKYMLGNIKHDGYIGENHKEPFIDLMHKYGATDTEIIQVLERININYQNKKNNNKSPKIYTVINMLNSEYKPYEISELDDYEYKKIYNPLITSLYDSIMKDGIESILKYLQEELSEEMQLQQFDYVMQNVINKVINSLQESVDNIKDLEYYKELKNIIIDEYLTNLRTFKLLKTYYHNKREKYDAIEVELEQEQIEEINEVNKLIYLPNASSTCLESDLKDIPEEFYDDVIKLLNNLKIGQLTNKNCRPFNGNKKLKSYRELRDDQLRILIRNIKENIYVVLGIFQKQDDNDLKGFLGRANRYNPNDYDSDEKIQYLMEKSIDANERIYSFLEENTRKGNR